jgi:hypothetical protein
VKLRVAAAAIVVAFWGAVSLVAMAVDGGLTDDAEWVRENDYVNASNYQRNTQGKAGELLAQVPEPADAPGALRVLAVGDSFVWGDGAADLDVRWPAQLETALERRTGVGSVRVQSLGQNGASTANEVEWLTRGALGMLRPDVVVVGLTSNDVVPPGSKEGVCGGFWCYGIRQIEDSEGYRDCRRGSAPGLPWVARHVIARPFRVLADDLMNKECEAWARRAASEQRGFPYARWVRETLKPASLRTYRDTADRLAATVGRTPIVILPTPVSDADIELLRRPLDILQDAGLSVIDIDETESLIRRSGDDLGINPVNGHPGPTLTRAYALDAAPRVLSLLQPRRSDQHEPELRVTNFLPLDLQVEPRAGGIDIAAAAAAAPEVASTTTLAGQALPPQHAPCALLGRPHAVIGLDEAETSSVRLELVSGAAVDVYGVDYGTVPPSVTRLAALDRRVPRTTRRVDVLPDALLLAPERGGSCDLSREIRLAPFELRIDADG